jgi:hypothetical protein
MAVDEPWYQSPPGKIDDRGTGRRDFLAIICHRKDSTAADQQMADTGVGRRENVRIGQ